MNRLASEKSPYLLQHSRNPVHWWAWSDEAIAAAQQQDKPIFLSVGYSTCYWCHVMERECFEDESIAAILNEHFIAIKVDREERPDIDAIYMEALLALEGSGGWPLSVFLTTELRPFFGGTYYTKTQFAEILTRIADTWRARRDEVESAGAQLLELIQVTSRSTQAQELEVELWHRAYAEFSQSYDREFGGFGEAPKFPAAGIIRFLLRYHQQFGDAQALEVARATLEKMARGGFYDLVGGGFHRYSTDAQWLIPHFEKMLYDNALLVPAYLECFQLTGEEFCAAVAEQTLEYVLREMRSEQGGFFSAQDAGSVGSEGEYYVWSESELEDELSATEFELLKESFSVSAVGNFESGFCVLRLQDAVEWQRLCSAELKSLIKKLLGIRQRRRPPHLDDKILTSWNGLMISALCKGFQVLQHPSYLVAAQQAATFLRQHMYCDGKLLRRFRDEEARFSGLLEDYAFVIQALLDLYESDFNQDWLLWAKELQEVVEARFWDAQEGGYFAVGADDPTLVVRKKEHSDTSLPGASAVCVANLLRLSSFSQRVELRDRALNALAAYSGFFKKYPAAFPYSFIALAYAQFHPVEIAIRAAADDELSKAATRGIYRKFLPTLVLAAGEGEQPEILAGKEKGQIHLCRDGACREPLAGAEVLQHALNEKLH